VPTLLSCHPERFADLAEAYAWESESDEADEALLDEGAFDEYDDYAIA
jgi:hypothetical protein